GHVVSVAVGPPVDPGSLVRSRRYRVLPVFAAVIGLLVSLASWAFLELVHAIQVEVYTRLPGHLGFDTVPSWWPLPWLALAGILQLRRRLDDLRLAGDRRSDRHRGRRAGWPDVAARPASGPARCRGRLARLHRHGRLDRP